MANVKKSSEKKHQEKTLSERFAEVVDNVEEKVAEVFHPSETKEEEATAEITGAEYEHPKFNKFKKGN